MRRFGQLSSDEHLQFLVGLVKHGYAPVVEFGTFTGHTARCLAEAGAVVHTVDVGHDVHDRCLGRASLESRELNELDASYGEYEVGEEFAGQELPITQYLGDSREIDLSPLYGTIGLVFVDGGHSYEVVRHDSDEAFRLIRPGGVIVWDDCNESWPGVVKVIDELLADSRDLLLNKKLDMAIYGWEPWRA